MGFFLKISVLVIFISSIGLVNAQENAPRQSDSSNPPPGNSNKDTPIPPAYGSLDTPQTVPESGDSTGISLEEAIQKVMQDSKNKILGAKTELENGKKIHVIKILTTKGHIQYIRIEAATGNILDKAKK